MGHCLQKSISWVAQLKPHFGPGSAIVAGPDQLVLAYRLHLASASHRAPNLVEKTGISYHLF